MLAKTNLGYLNRSKNFFDWGRAAPPHINTLMRWPTSAIEPSMQLDIESLPQAARIFKLPFQIVT